ncbi:MAG TPA: DinB family protein [Actinomycetota bacterium]
MSFTSPIERVEAPGAGDERTALGASLDFLRATMLRKMEGLSDEDLRRAVAPSGLSLLGLVKHLTEDEHAWFAMTFARTGEGYISFVEDDPESDMRAAPDETTEALVARYLEACERSRRIVAEAASLDERVPNERRGEVDLRFIMIHMIEEYARHAGHADLIRELIDGSTGL